MTTDHVHTCKTQKVKGKQQVQEFADNGKRTELVPEIPVRGKQVTTTIPSDEGDLGTDLRDQGGKEKIAKIRKIRKKEVGRKEPILEVVQTPQ